MFPRLFVTVLLAAFMLAPAQALSETEGASDEAAKYPWKVRAELSYVNVSGNTETQTLSGKLNIKKEKESDRYYLVGSYLQSETGSQESANKTAADATWEHLYSVRTFAFLKAGYLRDKFSGYDFRAYAGPGLGRDIVKTERHRLKGTIAVLYNHDEFSSGAKSTDDYATARGALRFDWQVRENFKFGQLVEASMSLADTKRSFVDSETKAEVKVNGMVSLGVSYIVNYQNQLPSPEIKHFDKTLLTTLIIDF